MPNREFNPFRVSRPQPGSSQKFRRKILDFCPTTGILHSVQRTAVHVGAVTAVCLRTRSYQQRMTLASYHHPAPEWKVVSFPDGAGELGELGVFLLGRLPMKEKAGLASAMVSPSLHLISRRNWWLSKYRPDWLTAETGECFGTPPSPSHWEVSETRSVATDWGQSPPRCCSVQSLKHQRISLSNIADDQLQGWLGFRLISPPVTI